MNVTITCPCWSAAEAMWCNYNMFFNIIFNSFFLVLLRHCTLTLCLSELAAAHKETDKTFNISWGKINLIARFILWKVVKVMAITNRK